MRITLDHALAHHGQPVALADDGSFLTGRKGLRRFPKPYGHSPDAMVELCGISARTVKTWASCQDVPAYALIAKDDRLGRDATI